MKLGVVNAFVLGGQNSIIEPWDNLAELLPNLPT